MKLKYEGDSFCFILCNKLSCHTRESYDELGVPVRLTNTGRDLCQGNKVGLSIIGKNI